jgi:hypothetical protein
MDGATVAEAAAGVAVVVIGLLILRHNRAVAAEMAEWNKLQYDRRVTLYDLDRAERLRKLYEAGPLDRLGAVWMGAIVIVIGVVLTLDAVA